MHDQVSRNNVVEEYSKPVDSTIRLLIAPTLKNQSVTFLATDTDGLVRRVVDL